MFSGSGREDPETIPYIWRYVTTILSIKKGDKCSVHTGGGKVLGAPGYHSKQINELGKLSWGEMVTCQGVRLTGSERTVTVPDNGRNIKVRVSP